MMGMQQAYSGPLTDDQVRTIDLAARRILAGTGVKIKAQDGVFLDFISKAGARVDPEQNRAFFDEECLNRLLASAPSQFTLFSRDGENDIQLGCGKVHFVNGGRVFRILDMGTGGYRETMLRDIANTATIVQQLEHVRFYIIACQAHDLSVNDAYHLNDFYQALAHTSKHVMGGCDRLDGMEQVYQLACLVAGGEEAFRARPFISIITNPISPLTLGQDTLEILQFCARKGIPVTCAPAPIAGTTAPATLAGTLVQMHAEALAGVAFCQAFAPGAAILYGAVPTTMDLRKMNFCLGSVETAMLSAAAVQLAKTCKLPIYGTGGGTESKRPDIQAGAEKSLSNLLAALSGADCIHLAAGMLDSANSISYEQYVIDDEMIGMIQRLLAGIRVNEESCAEDVIAKVGPGGHYVTEEHTVNNMMQEFFFPRLSVRSLFDVWEQEGRPDMLSKARLRVEEILASSQEAIFDPKLILKLKDALPDLIA